jgi:hypothetical protein
VPIDGGGKGKQRVFVLGGDNGVAARDCDSSKMCVVYLEDFDMPQRISGRMVRYSKVRRRIHPKV